MKKLKITAEGAYVLGQILLALGTALVASANFGVSMVVAPAYLISEKVPFLTFGMAEYTFQALLICVICLILRRFRIKYLLSFVTAFIYGCLLDLDMQLISLGGDFSLAARCGLFAAGVILTAVGVAFFFNTYLPPGVYELFVKEVSGHFRLDIGKFKIAYDCTSLAVACVMSVIFFGVWPLRGIGVGTVTCAAVNGAIISAFSKLMQKKCDFAPLFDPPKWLK